MTKLRLTEFVKKEMLVIVSIIGLMLFAPVVKVSAMPMLSVSTVAVAEEDESLLTILTGDSTDEEVKDIKDKKDKVEKSAEMEIFDLSDFLSLLMRFFFNSLIVLSIIHFFYYPKSMRCDYYFTFTLISISIFLMIFLLGSVKLKIGFALGLFAIFGIIRYRTESMPVREMTYLFVIIAISVINALAVTVSMVELVVTNLLFVLSVWLCEKLRLMKHISSKLVLYDRVDLIVPEKEKEMFDDLQKRTGLVINKVEIGAIDFLRDTVMLKVSYEPKPGEINSVDNMIKLPKPETM